MAKGKRPQSVSAAEVKAPAVVKAVAIVRYLNSARSSGAPLKAIAADLKITKSHCHNILKALSAEGWLAYDEARRAYCLAPRMLADISGLIGRPHRSALIHDELMRLSRATGMPCVLTRVERDGSFVAIDKAEEMTELLVSVPIGHRFPLDAPAQMRARIAWLPLPARNRELEQWKPTRYTDTTLVSKKAVAAELDATRQRGYAISRAEFSAGVMSLAAPIFDAFDNVQMVLQCPGLMATVETREPQIAKALLESAERLNRLFRNASSEQAA